MAPVPQEHPSIEVMEPPSSDPNRVVISGMSGLFPESNSVKELSEILYNKKNPVNNENMRWKFNHPEVAEFTGKVMKLNRFDAQFFKVHYRLSNVMDAMAKKLLEQSYQAIYDAGVNPEHLSGKKVGVYIGTAFSEMEKACFYVTIARGGFGIAGCSKTMFANRISYWLNAKGPSMAVDDACCSSTVALEQAYQAISRGECEAAIVGGGNMCLHPQSSVHYANCMKLSRDGKTKSFDKHADGCSKSDVINVLFLQKAKDAFRIYADVLNVKCEFTEIPRDENGGPRYGFYRNPSTAANFLNSFYKEVQVPPQAVEYVEAFGCAVPEADKNELDTLSQVFCKDRTDPLLVGSVTSNIGYTEAGSGVTAVIKVLLGYHTGKLAGNLHYSTPHNDVDAIKEGKMRIVSEHTRFNRTYAAVNGLAVTGLNAHVLLHGHYKPKDKNRYKSSIPQLVAISGRHEAAVTKILDELKSLPVDPEQIHLLRHIHETRITGHLGRGYTILDTDVEDNTVCIRETADYHDEAKRPLWFVYSGMGSQWAGMGTHLMRIPIFSAAIEKCHRVLEPKGVNIVEIITSPDKTMFDNILHSFVGIAAVQIGLTDILKALGIVPDNIIGHSVGELGCAYADGCFTAEEMILAAYSRGLVSVQTPFIKGSMAAVGIGYREVVKQCPPEIEVACHNGPDSCTISGPADIMKEFVTSLTEKGIFAKEVPCSNIAYHSRYIAEAGPALLKYLREVIKEPKRRSERWVSTSVPQERWQEDAARYSSPEYHTNNLLNSVLFEEASLLVPANAVCVEIAPHGLLQAILKRSLPSCKHIPLTKRGHPDNALMILDGLGRLFMEGFNPKIHALYPKVELPVSTGTPMLSHLVEWEHTEKWDIAMYVTAERKMAAACKYVISMHDQEYTYLKGHVVRGRVRYPFASALVSTWDTLLISMGAGRVEAVGRGAEGGVTFHDVRLYAAPALHDQQAAKLTVQLHRGNKRFEIVDQHSQVATGFVTNELDDLAIQFNKEFTPQEKLTLNSKDVYRILNERDYAYKGDFRSILSSNISFSEAEIVWQDDWVTFIDGILQFHALRQSHSGVSQPSNILRLTINLNEHTKRLKQVGDKIVATAQVFEQYGYTRCGGVIVEHIKFVNLPPLEEEEVSLRTLKFYPRFQADVVDVSTALQVYLEILCENAGKDLVNVIGISSYDDKVLNRLQKVSNGIPGISVNYKQIKKEKIEGENDKIISEADLVVVQNLTYDEKLIKTLFRVLKQDIFVLNIEQDCIESKSSYSSSLYRIVSSFNSSNSKLELIKWRPTLISAPTTVKVSTQSDIKSLKHIFKKILPHQNLIVFASYPIPAGLKQLVKKLREETKKNQIFVFVVDDKDMDHMSADKIPQLDLTFNMFKDGVWGGEFYVDSSSYAQKECIVRLQSAPNDLRSMSWNEVPAHKERGIPVQVHYASLNHLDAQRVAGVIPCEPNSKLGYTHYAMDYSGVTDSGVRVMGVVRGDAASTRVVGSQLTWPVPEHWSLLDAATVPLPYAHAIYCLAIKMKILPGLRILVHGGTGALGQAVISIALAHDCEVFATVSDVRKKEFLKKLFPVLQDDHIGNSRDQTFADKVLTLTKGMGVNVVIGYSTGDLLNASLSCLSFSGIHIDTSQLKTQEEFSYGMYYLTKERSYCRVDFSSIFNDLKKEEVNRVQHMVADGISRGYVRPLSRVVYPAEQAARAINLLQGSRHRGRVVLDIIGTSECSQAIYCDNNDKVDEGRVDKTINPGVGTLQDKIRRRLVCTPDLVLAVVIDDETLGLQVTDLLVACGATKLHIHVSKTTAYLDFKTHSWQQQGVEVHISSCYLHNAASAVDFVQTSKHLGPVEGFYVVTKKKNNDDINNEMAAILNYLDEAARKLCPDVKNFAVITEDSDVGEQVVQQRISNDLPATSIQLPKLKQIMEPCKVGGARGLSWRDGVRCVERALASRGVLRGYAAGRKPRQSLLAQVARVAGISIPTDVDESATLLDLGIEVSKSAEVAAFFRYHLSVAIPEHSIPKLTVPELKEVEVSIYGPKFPKVRGLGTFYNYVDSDEMLATTDMVLLPTLTHSDNMRDDEFDYSQRYLCVVPGMEGHYERFRLICERLKMPAIVLQPGFDRLAEGLDGLAHRYAEVLLKKTKLKEKFYLLGYESGVIVALEMAAILEKQGLVGTVVCLGPVPTELKAVIKEETGYLEGDALRDLVLKHMFNLMGGITTTELEQALTNAWTWDKKLSIYIRTLVGHVSHSSQYAKSIFEAAYARIIETLNYTINPKKLKSKIVLMRAKDQGNSNELQAYSEQPIEIHQLQMPLAHSTKDIRCSTIINKCLYSEIEEDFKKKIPCETYLLNPNTFMTNCDEEYV